jgi:heme exporter protein D
VHRLAVAAALVGGAVWTATVLLTALRPVGSSGAARSTLDLHPTILVSFVLMASSATAFASYLRPSKVAWAGIAASWLAVALFSVNVAVVVGTGDDAPVWPTHYASFFFMALAMALLGIAGLQHRAVPAAAAFAMIPPPMLMPFGNMQDGRVMLWLPLGIASLALAILLISGMRRHRPTGSAEAP